MLNKIKIILNDFRSQNSELKSRIDSVLANSNELQWANIYHDSIRGIPFINSLSLNIGRWAGNYSFFYVLNRILNEAKPKTILELGLGESTKMVSLYLSNHLVHSNHIIIEHDKEWIENFKANFSLDKKSEIVHLNLIEIEKNGFKTQCYEDLHNKINRKFNLYIVDGPWGSNRFSRINILPFVEKITQLDEFIILMDDTNRIGEQDTLNEILKILNENNITNFIGSYSGIKTSTLVVSKSYKYFCSL
jgi:hypothetical protein